jgi:hypothetical protein
MGDSSSLKEKGSSRFRFDERMKKVFNDLYVSHNGGEFKDVIKNESRGNNFDRSTSGRASQRPSMLSVD